MEQRLSRLLLPQQVIRSPDASAALANSTTYTVTITGGATGVKDIAGNALAANYAGRLPRGSGSGAF